MYVHYVRQLLGAEEGLTEAERAELAEQVASWAERNQVRDITEIHRTLDEWVDMRKKKVRTISLHGVADDTPGLEVFLEDKAAPSPADVMIAEEEFRYPGPAEARSYIEEHLDGEPRELLLTAIKPRRGRYVVDEDHPIILQHADILAPRIKKGCLLVPKKLVSFKLSEAGFQIEYMRGFSDDRINQALLLYSKGFKPVQIARMTGIKENTISNWLYAKMDLPRIGLYDTEWRRLHNERNVKILDLYDSGKRPMEIVEDVGCSIATVCEIIKDFRCVEFGGGGLDPWVFTPTGAIASTAELLRLDLPRKRERHGPEKNYSCTERYRMVFTYISAFFRDKGRGPTRDEIHGTLDFNPWHYLDDMVHLGVLDKKMAPKESIDTYGVKRR